MFRLIASSVFAAVAIGCSGASPPEITNDRLAEGVYCTTSEISGYTGTTLELKDGRFRYWFYTDIADPDGPKYPITGEYEFQNGAILLNADENFQRRWFVDVVNGTPVLWRQDAFDVWIRDRKIYDYGILVWTENELPEGGAYQLQRPSIRVLYNEQMKRQIKEWKDPFVHGME